LRDNIAPPKIKEDTKNKRELFVFITLTIAKNPKIAKRRGTNVIKESFLFADNMEERKTEKANKIRGKSKIVRLRRIDPSAINFKAKRIITAITMAPNKICLGSTKISVVRDVKTRGNAKSKIPNKKTDTAQEYRINSFLFCIVF